MEMGRRARLVALATAALAVVVPLVLVVAGAWLLATAAFAAGLAAMAVIMTATLWRSSARAHAELVQLLTEDRMAAKQVLGRTQRLNRQMLTRDERMTAQLEQLSLRVAFPALAPSVTDEDAVSTRFTDYPANPTLRQSDRAMALLETLARHSIEHQAFENDLLARLDAMSTHRERDEQPRTTQ